jgi:hypothetical protein
MPALETIEAEIKALPKSPARQLQDWLADYLDDHEELNPEFVDSIEQGKKDVQSGQVRVR